MVCNFISAQNKQNVTTRQKVVNFVINRPDKRYFFVSNKVRKENQGKALVFAIQYSFSTSKDTYNEHDNLNSLYNIKSEIYPVSLLNHLGAVQIIRDTLESVSK